MKIFSRAPFLFNFILFLGGICAVSPLVWAADNVSLVSVHHDMSWGGAVLFAMLGGIILNLMPCVFPILSMKALSLCKLSAKESSAARWQGLEYTAGVMVSFAAIAAILMALKAGGAHIGWGFHLQNPVIVLFLIYLLFAIGLNLSGFFEVKSLLGNWGQAFGASHKAGSAFMTGVLATAVASPCTAPFMGAAMGFALTQPVFVGLSVFLALGFGLALPYLALTFSPPLQRLLPKPGAWMAVFKEILAFPMYGAVIWLVWVLGQQWGMAGVVKALAGLLIFCFALWLWPKAASLSRVARYGVRVVGILAVLIAFFAGCEACKMPMARDVAQTIDNMAADITEAWQDGDGGGPAIPFGEAQPFSPSLLKQVLDGPHGVFVNMTAAWCITCKANERVALSRPEVKQHFRDQSIIYLKGDWTNQDPAITDYLARFERQGVPLYVYYGAPVEKTGLRPAPVILPQILTPTVVKAALH